MPPPFEKEAQPSSAPMTVFPAHNTTGLPRIGLRPTLQELAESGYVPVNWNEVERLPVGETAFTNPYPCTACSSEKLACYVLRPLSFPVDSVWIKTCVRCSNRRACDGDSQGGAYSYHINNGLIERTIKPGRETDADKEASEPDLRPTAGRMPLHESSLRSLPASDQRHPPTQISPPLDRMHVLDKLPPAPVRYSCPGEYEHLTQAILNYLHEYPVRSDAEAERRREEVLEAAWSSLPHLQLAQRLKVRYPLYIAINGQDLPLPTINIENLLSSSSAHRIDSAVQTIREGSITNALALTLLDRVDLVTPPDVHVLGSRLHGLESPSLLMGITYGDKATDTPIAYPKSLVFVVVPVMLVFVGTSVYAPEEDLDELCHSLRSTLGPSLDLARFFVGRTPSSASQPAAWHIKAVASLLAVGGVFKYSSIPHTAEEFAERLNKVFAMNLTELQEMLARMLESDRATAGAIQSALLQANMFTQIISGLENAVERHEV